MNQSDLSRNYYMLEKGPLSRQGYDWWWHNFTAYHKETGKAKAFFIEYYVCNPALAEKTAVLGQLEENKKKAKKPSYAMIKVGTWGEDPRQIHNFYPIADFKATKAPLTIQIGPCSLSEEHMKGYCKVSENDSLLHPEYMCNGGEMSWDLKIKKKIPFHVGYGASEFFRKLNAFEMFWHAEGIKTEYEGELIYQGQVYQVIPEKSYGYADKNWGKDYTSPWLWISSCHMKSLFTGRELENSAIEFGGGRPKAFGLDLGKKILGCFHYEGTEYEFNFSRFWTGAKVEFKFHEGKNENIWKVKAKNHKAYLTLTLHCPKEEMLLIQYEAPNGKKLHNKLWNGGTGYGELKLYHIYNKTKTLIDHIAFENTGCEYGEYDS